MRPDPFLSLQLYTQRWEEGHAAFQGAAGLGAAMARATRLPNGGVTFRRITPARPQPIILTPKSEPVTPAPPVVELPPEADGPVIRIGRLGSMSTDQRDRIGNKLADIQAWRSGQPSVGEQFKNDGTTFQNREGLPHSEKGYEEYTVVGRDGKKSGARLCINLDDGSVYYSGHYSKTTGFTRIDDAWDQLGGWK